MTVGTEIDVERMCDFALRMIGAPSLSGEEAAVAEVVAEEMRALGFAVAVDDWGNVVGTIDHGPGPCALFDAHIDTVGVNDRARWSRDPGGQREGCRLYGRGAMDMKGPLAACLHGVAAATPPRGRLVVSASVCEELVEGPALVHVAERVEPDVVVVCEATGLRIARGQRGRLELSVEVRGRATHSSQPQLGVNAVQGMVDVLLALRALEPPRDDVLGEGVLVVTDIVSEPYPGLSVVPHRCVATLDRRTLPGEDADAIVADVARVAADALGGTEATVTVSVAVDRFTTYTGAAVSAPNFAPAWRCEEDDWHVAAARRALATAGGSAELTHYAFCTNGSGTAGALGIPTLGFGPGDEALAHRDDEHIEVAALAAGARAYARIAEELLRAHEEAADA